MTNALNDLNDYLQQNHKVASLSWHESASGPKHEPVWTSICRLDGQDKGIGHGPTKRKARIAAATMALAALTGT